MVRRLNLPMEWTVKNPSTRSPQNENLGLLPDSVQDGPWSQIRPLVHHKIIFLVQRPNSSMRWTVWAQIFIRCPHGRMDGCPVRRRPSSFVEAWFNAWTSRWKIVKTQWIIIISSLARLSWSRMTYLSKFTSLKCSKLCVFALCEH